MRACGSSSEHMLNSLLKSTIHYHFRIELRRIAQVTLHCWVHACVHFGICQPLFQSKLPRQHGCHRQMHTYINDMMSESFFLMYVRAIKYFTYRCLRMKNTLQCVLHFASSCSLALSLTPHIQTIYVCGKYVAVFSIFNQFHNLIYLCLKDRFAKHLGRRTNAMPISHFWLRRMKCK